MSDVERIRHASQVRNDLKGGQLQSPKPGTSSTSASSTQPSHSKTDLLENAAIILDSHLAGLSTKSKLKAHVLGLEANGLVRLRAGMIDFLAQYLTDDDPQSSLRPPLQIGDHVTVRIDEINRKIIAHLIPNSSFDHVTEQADGQTSRLLKVAMVISGIQSGLLSQLVSSAQQLNSGPVSQLSALQTALSQATGASPVIDSKALEMLLAPYAKKVDSGNGPTASQQPSQKTDANHPVRSPHPSPALVPTRTTVPALGIKGDDIAQNWFQNNLGKVVDITRTDMLAQSISDNNLELKTLGQKIVQSIVGHLSRTGTTSIVATDQLDGSYSLFDIRASEQLWNTDKAHGEQAHRLIMKLASRLHTVRFASLPLEVRQEISGLIANRPGGGETLIPAPAVIQNKLAWIMLPASVALNTEDLDITLLRLQGKPGLSPLEAGVDTDLSFRNLLPGIPFYQHKGETQQIRSFAQGLDQILRQIFSKTFTLASRPGEALDFSPEISALRQQISVVTQGQAALQAEAQPATTMVPLDQSAGLKVMLPLPVFGTEAASLALILRPIPQHAEDDGSGRHEDENRNNNSRAFSVEITFSSIGAVRLDALMEKDQLNARLQLEAGRIPPDQAQMKNLWRDQLHQHGYEGDLEIALREGNTR